MATNERDTKQAANGADNPHHNGASVVPQQHQQAPRNPDMQQQQQGEQPGAARQQGSGSGRGFAGMDEARQRAIAAEGGRAAHQKGTAHEFTSEEAREAGRKGGEARALNARNAALNASRAQPQN
jgi:general stress protein YciG